MTPRTIQLPRGWPAGPGRAGGEMLYTDIGTFNAVHDALAGDGSHFTGNHVFGHSYGSTTTAYAEANGETGAAHTTVTLVSFTECRAARSASDFGIDTHPACWGNHIEVEGTVFKIIEFQHVEARQGRRLRAHEAAPGGRRRRDRPHVPRRREVPRRSTPRRARCSSSTPTATDAHFMDEESYEQIALPGGRAWPSR